jgi:hypothetical protein
VHLDLWLPNKLTKKTELAMKRAVVSCLDLISDVAAIGTNASMAAPGRLEVEDIVARAGDSAPTQDIAVRLLRSALTAATTEFDATIKREKETVKRLGGLYVIGTSRHESRRIDNQLRGTYVLTYVYGYVHVYIYIYKFMHIHVYISYLMSVYIHVHVMNTYI